MSAIRLKEPWQALALQSVAGAEIGYRLRGVGDPKSETGARQGSGSILR